MIFFHQKQIVLQQCISYGLCIYRFLCCSVSFYLYACQILLSFLNIGLSLLDKVKADSYDDIDDDYVVNMNINHTTTVSVSLDDESNEIYDYPLKSKTTQKTTTLKNSTTSHHHSMDDYDDEDRAYKNDDDETDLTTTTTLSTSPAEKVKFSTTSTTEITTTTTKIPVTRSSWSYTRVFDGDSFRWWTTTTLDPAVVAAYIAKTSKK